jgi:oxaloacetate decarboxylase alpha subunit
LPYYVNLAKEVTALGAHSICIKDMSGILLPHVAEKLIKALKKVVDIPINLHGHDTSGVMAATYLRAIDVGVDMLDTAMSPFSSGNSQPPTESILNMLYPDDLHLHYQVDALASAKRKLTQIRQTFIDDGTLTFDALTPYPEILKTQVPGGMLSNLYSQLKQQHMEHKFMEVLAEVPKVRADLGYPPLVTPISQFIGVQASLNVMTNKRYHMVPNEIKQYLSGYYGKICGPLNQKVMKKIGITNHTYEPQFEFEEYKAERKKYDENSYSDENILSSIIIGPAYVLKQDVINDVIGEKKQYNFDIRFIEDAEFTLLAPYDCKIMHVHVALHQAVEENDIILTLLTTDQVHLEVLAPCKGLISQIYCHDGSSLLNNQPLFKLMR